MLVVLSRGEVLLQKRPPSGIWGGLWSLPEIEVGPDPARELRRSLGIEAARTQRLEPFEHAFTHFTLEVEPWLVTPRRPAALAERSCVWMPLAELAGAALPSPVRRLLKGLGRGSNQSLLLEELV